jgi:hypothetical protein
MTANLFRTIELLNKIILQKDQLLLGLQEKRPQIILLLSNKSEQEDKLQLPVK